MNVLDLDSYKIPDFEVKLNGQLHKFDSAMIALKIAAIPRAEQPVDTETTIPYVQKVFGIPTIETLQAVVLLREFEQFISPFSQTFVDLFRRWQGPSEVVESPSTSIESDLPKSN
jgi:hypothetical protein